MRKFTISEISGVDTPCQAPARAVIFKRGEPPESALPEAIEASGGADWSKTRETALQALQTGAEALAKAEGMSGPAAYDAFLSSPEGAALYAQTS